MAIACTIEEAEVPERIVLIERMRGAMTTLVRTPNGLLINFTPEPSVEADVRRFALDEKRCCQFWGFEVAADPETLMLRWEGPPDAQSMLDRLADFLQGVDPASTLSALL